MRTLQQNQKWKTKEVSDERMVYLQRQSLKSQEILEPNVFKTRLRHEANCFKEMERINLTKSREGVTQLAKRSYWKDWGFES